MDELNGLFDLMSDEHDLTLLDTEMLDIVEVCKKYLIATEDPVVNFQCSDGLAGEPVTGKLEVWVRHKLVSKHDEKRQFDKGYKLALEDVLGKIKDGYVAS